MRRKIMVIVLALAVGVLAGACKQTVAEKVIENQTGGKVKVDADKGSVEIKSKDGSVKVGEDKLPGDFPDDLPVYKPSKVGGSMSNTLEGKKSFVVTLTTKDSLADVVDFYKRELSDNGWTEKSVLTGGEGGSQYANISYEKGEALVTVTTTRTDGDKETQMVISHNPKP